MSTIATRYKIDPVTRTGLETAELRELAAKIRYLLVENSHRAHAPHLGSCLSCVDILTAAYWNILNVDHTKPADPDRDRFVLSKGHGAPALFMTLALRGFIPDADIETFGQDGTLLGEHPGVGCAPGVEAATGSLGHGFPMGVGMALAAKIKKQSYRVICLLSDGECNEGSTWEAAMMAPAKKLDNLMTIVDFNKWQATGRSEEILSLNPLMDKWRSFGWNAHEVDGHDIDAILKLMEKLPDGSGKPVAIVAHTVKGKGISFMEDDNNWHYRIPKEEEVQAAREELKV